MGPAVSSKKNEARSLGSLRVRILSGLKDTLNPKPQTDVGVSENRGPLMCLQVVVWIWDLGTTSGGLYKLIRGSSRVV